MSVEKVDLNWEEILSGASTGIVRDVQSLRQNIQWGQNIFLKICQLVSLILE